MEQITNDSGLQPMWPNSSTSLAPITIIRDNLRRHELIRRLVRRDLDTRFRGPYLGYSWAILEPLLLAFVYSFVFGILVGKSDPNYPMTVMLGVIAWSLFSKCLNETTNTLSANASLFQFTKIPKSVFAFAKIGTNFTLSCISLLALIPLMIHLNIPFHLGLLLLPLWLFLIAIFGMSIGLFLAPSAVDIPDITNIVRFIARIGFFVSPVMWTYEMLERKFGTGDGLVIAHLNPVIVPITMLRDITFQENSEIPIYGYGMFAGLFLITYLLGSMRFQKLAHKKVVGL